jgi:alkyl hydroperoxide reductase 1
MTDVDLAFSKQIGWFSGDRAARYALVIDNGKVVYAARETKPKSIETTGAEAVLPKL